MVNRKLLSFGAIVVVLHVVQEAFIGTTPFGSFLSNSLQISCAIAAIAACFGAIHRGKGFTRPFWLLIGLSSLVWIMADLGWMYYESYLRVSPARDSIFHFFVDCRWLFLILALLLDPDEEERPHYFDPSAMLDAVQVFVIFVLIYVGWYYAVSLHQSRELSILRSDQIELSENLAVLALAGLQIVRARTAELRKLYFGFLICFVPVVAGTSVTDFIELHGRREIPTGTWLDLWWSVPFLLAASWASGWQQRPGLYASSSKDKRIASMLVENTLYAAGPLIVLLQVTELGPEWRKLSFSLLGISIVCFGARLALSEFREAEAARRLRLAHGALIESEARFRTLIEDAPLAVGISRSAKTVWVNRKYLELFGYESKEELVGQPISDMVAPECREELEERARLRASGQSAPISYELIGLRRDGTKFDAHIEVARVMLPDGPATLGFLSDVSERQRAENALRESEDRYRDLVEHSEDLVCTHDLQGNLLSVNPAPARLLGYEVNELVKIPMRDQVVPEYRALFDDYLARIKTNGADKGLMVVMTRSGEQRIWEYSNTLRTEGVATPIVRGIAHDVTEKRRAVLALSKSEQRYRMLFEKNIAGVAISGAEGEILDCNDGWARILGYSRAEEIRGYRAPEFYFDLADREPLLSQLQREGSFLSREMRLRRKDGTPVWVLFDAAVLDGGGDGKSLVQATAIDITERKKAEQALRDSEQRYRFLFEKTVAGVAIISLEGQLIDCNDAWARMFGHSDAGECRGGQIAGCYPNPPDRELLVAELKQTGACLNRELQFRRKDGTLFWVLSNSVLLTDSESQPLIQSTVFEITARKEAEQALCDAKEFSENLIQTANVMILALDTDGNVNLLNGAGEEITGYTFAELKGKNWSALVPRDRFPHVWEEFDRLVAGTAGDIFENPILTRKGEERYISWRSSTLKVNGKIVATISFGNDITERKRAEDALRRREEDYRRFVAQSSEGIFREDMDVPVSINLPEDELIQHILHDSYMAECNDALAGMYGFTSGQELVGKRLSEMLVVDDPRNIELTRDYIRSGFRVLDRESHELDIHNNPKVFRNSMIGVVENGKLLRSWGIQRDVTEQVKLEAARGEALEALRKSEDHFRLLVEQASEGIFLADAQGKYLEVNSAGVEMLGYTRDEILQLSIADIVVREDVPRIATEVARFEGGTIAISEWKIRRKDGSIFTGEVSGRQLPDGQLQGILRDVTERRKAQEALRQSEERFRVVLKDSPITVFNQDRDLRYTWIYNPQLYWQQDIIGKTDEEIIGAKKAWALTELKRRVLRSAIAIRQEVAIQQNGNRYAFDITVEPLLDSKEQVVGITGACIDIARLREMADRLQESRDRLAREKTYLEGEIQAELGFEEIIGHTSSLREVLRKARVVAPTNSTVLLLGETGTGKELVARSVHDLSTRHDKTFVKLNCAAVPSGLLESELFGHEKGAFTGAVSQKVGRIELADKGTLFLDEIGELPLELQPKLLRVLQDREFERLGAVKTLHVDVRIIAATNRDLRQDIADKKFREDLFYRLNVFPIEMPPLRDRREDIPLLVYHFVRKHAAKMAKHVDEVPSETMQILCKWSWPGNIRELENLIERMVIMTKGTVLAPPPAEVQQEEASAEDDLAGMERDHIIRVLRETNGVLSGTQGAASRLGLKRTTLQSMMKRLGIAPREYRAWGNGTFGKQ